MLRNQPKRPMNITETILSPILAILFDTDKWQRDFIIELFNSIFSRQGRVNFENLSRYSKYNELTHRRQFTKFFDWFSFNLSFVDLSVDTHIGVIDCSFVNKSGKKTFGIDNFWSGVANIAKKGLEISVLGCINVNSGKATVLDVSQTPAGLAITQTAKTAKKAKKAKTAQTDKTAKTDKTDKTDKTAKIDKIDKTAKTASYTRIDYYLEQILDCLPKLTSIIYFVADGFYAKTKIFDTLSNNSKHLITKLRVDANLKYLNNKPRTKSQRGATSKYDGKVVFNDLSKWVFIGSDEKYAHLSIYSQKLYAVNFDRVLRVVLLLNTKTNKYVLLACTDTELEARLITKYYQLRFQIEFLFRDAKQFMGLNDCQARDENKLDFHFNASLSAVNIARKAIEQNQIYNKSMNNFMRQHYNQKLVQNICSQLSLNAEFDLINPVWDKAIMWGNLAA
jgi:Transposase DDE domain